MLSFLNTRHSYRGLMDLDPYGLFKDGKLVATVRAHGPKEAWQIFSYHGLEGQSVFMIKGWRHA